MTSGAKKNENFFRAKNSMIENVLFAYTDLNWLLLWHIVLLFASTHNGLLKNPALDV